MGATIQGYSQSTISVKSDGIQIRLPKGVFGKGWGALLNRLLAAIGQRPLMVNSQRVMTQREPGEEAPRWKQSCIDALSWLLFLLKVPTNHQLVRLWQAVDWRAINRIAGAKYKNAHGGRPAWAPAQLVAMLVLRFLYGVPYETAIVARIRENIVWCWFCGFGLFGPFPTHDALYELRKRIGIEGFEQILTIAVQACLEAGLIANELVLFDLMAVTASAHRWSPYERAVILTRALIRYLELEWADQTPEAPFPEALRLLAAQVALQVLPHQRLEEVKPERVLKSVERWNQKAEEMDPTWQTTSDAIVDALVGEARLPPLRKGRERSTQRLRTWLSGIAKQVMAQLPHARGDPDARVGRTSQYTWFCGYWMGFVVDSLRQVITAVVWGAGNLKQVKLFIPALEAHIQRVGQPRATATDSALDDPQVHAYLEQAEIEGHITPRAHVSPPDGGYGTDRVTWVEDLNQPLCPGGQPLQPKGKPQKGRQTYEGTACADCRLYRCCYPTGEGELKRFTLNPTEHRRWQANRAHRGSEAYKRAQRQRFVAEGRFGLAAMNHRGTKAPYRSQAMNHIAGLMIALVMNLRLLSQHRRKERLAA